MFFEYRKARLLSSCANVATESNTPRAIIVGAVESFEGMLYVQNIGITSHHVHEFTLRLVAAPVPD